MKKMFMPCVDFLRNLYVFRPMFFCSCYSALTTSNEVPLIDHNFSYDHKGFNRGGFSGQLFRIFDYFFGALLLLRMT